MRGFYPLLPHEAHLKQNNKVLNILFSPVSETSPQKYWSADPRRGESSQPADELGIGLYIYQDCFSVKNNNFDQRRSTAKHTFCFCQNQKKDPNPNMFHLCPISK